ncbi:MAG: hypothetical protein ACE5LH_09360 [Fidelibacterota bacterium]
MVYVVSYELRGARRDYRRLYDELRNSSGWWHYLGSTWLISTDESANELYERLATAIGSNDGLLIIEAGRTRQGWLPEEAWAWIREHI